MTKKNILLLACFFVFGVMASLAVRLMPMQHASHGDSASNHSSHAPTPPEASVELPHLPLQTIAGDRTTPAAIAAGKPLLLNFWASWCAPCLRELPLLDAARQQHQINTIGVSYEELAVIEKFHAQHPVSFPLYKASFDIFYVFQQHGNRTAVMPYTMLLGGDGAVLATKLGDFKTIDEIIAFTKQATGE